MKMTAQCETSDFYRGNSMDVSYVFEPITTITPNATTTSATTTSSSVDESTSISPTDSANTSNVNIAQAANKPKLGTYLIDRTIGKGIFSVVKLATHTITGIDLAIKIIDKTRLDAENLVKIYRESEILKKLHHPNIVKLFQVMETPRLLYIAMEFLPNGEVFDYIANHGRFPEPEARVKFMDVLLAVDHIHSMGIVHRDIKAENLLFDAQMNIKLTDFSFGTHFSSSSSQPLLTTWCGSPPYAAPEIFKGEPYVGTKADIWSLGVVLYVMVCGTLPFDAQPLPHLKNQVLSASFRVPYWLSLTCERLIRSMLSKSPAKRPSTQEIMQHPWLTNTPIPNSKSTQLPLHQASVGALLTETHIPIGHRIPERPFNSIDVTYSSLTAGMAHPDRRCPSLIEHPVTSELTMSNSAPDGEMSTLNELVLFIMESLGMKRSQILESLERRAYDHLMATYLLLGEKLRRHRHSLSFASLTKSSGATRTVNGLDTSTSSVTKPDLGVGIVHSKHSCVDSAVDVKSSLSETEFNGSSILSMSVPDTEVHCDSYGTTRWHDTDHSHLTTRPDYTAAWSPNPDSALPTPTLPTTDTTLGLPSYSDNHAMLHTCPQSNVVNKDIVIDDDETPLFHMQQSLLSHNPPIDLSTSSELSATTNRGALSVSGAPGSFNVPEQPPLVCGRNPTVNSYESSNKFTPVTGPSTVQTNHNHLPWVIHSEHDEKPASSSARRRTLVRRKYGVFTPPDNLSQLAQVALAQNSTNPVQHTADLIDEDLG